MENRKYYSFERNNYYYGKMLTSRDFQNEQSYMNDKRRLGNRLFQGSGIVYGLDVVAADDSSVILQSGMALDRAGREIVVPRTQVLKLSTIDGYEELKTDRAALGIAYAEEDTDPVYAVMETGGNGKSYNRKKEGYRLFLCDRQDCVRDEKKEEQYLKSCRIYEDEDLYITEEVPTFVTERTVLKTRTRIRKISHAPGVCSFSANVTAEGMLPGNFAVHGENISLEYGEEAVLEQEFHPESYIFGKEPVKLSFTDTKVTKSGGEEKGTDAVLEVLPVRGTVLSYLRRTGHAGALDIDLDRTYDEKLWIAEIRLIRSQSHSIIERVDKPPFDQYVCTAEQLYILEKLKEYLVPEQEAGAGVNTERLPERTVGAELPVREKRMNSSGVFELSLGSGGEAGKVYFSDEIMHGLGNGPVCVELGIEYISRDTVAQGDREAIILGDGSIFAEDTTITEDRVFEVDQAIKILPERGTFIVGIRPKTKLGKIGIRIRWYAFKPEDLEQRVYNRKEQKGCIMLQPDTIVLAPKGSAHIQPVFINMPEEALSYTLLDPEGGKVDNNGVYTAPAQEGVYEIRIEAVSNPEIFTHAFVIVSQKNTAD